MYMRVELDDYSLQYGTVSHLFKGFKILECGKRTTPGKSGKPCLLYSADNVRELIRVMELHRNWR